MNTTIPHPQSAPTPVIQTRPQFDAVIENIVRLQLERTELETSQEKEIATIRHKYRAPLAEIDRYLLLETIWAETWAQQNRAAFGERRSLECTHAVVGFRTTPPRLERVQRRATWAEIALKLAEAAWGRRYLRQPAPEVNKEALLSDRLKLSPAELRQAGLRIVQEERFYLTPHGAAEPAEQREAA